MQRQQAGEKIAQPHSAQQCCKSARAGCRPEVRGGSSEVPSSPTALLRPPQALALSTASGAHRQPPGAAAAPLPDRSGGSRGLRGDAAEARGRQKGRGCEPLRRRSPPEPLRPRRCCLAQGTRRSSPREALTALIGSAQSRAAGCELLPSSHPSPRPPPPPPPGPQSPPAEPPSEQMPPVPNEADPEVPRMDPRILIFLLYVMILHELVSGWMEYQKQIAKPKKQAGPVWSSR